MRKYIKFNFTFCAVSFNLIIGRKIFAIQRIAGDDVKHVIGFDGGGTKTEMIISNMDMKPLLTLKGGPCNPKSVSYDKAIDTLLKLLDEGYQTSGLMPTDCLSICLGIAGIDGQMEQETFATAIRHYIHQWAAVPIIRVTNDAEIALTAALGRNVGIIAIAGTGAIVYGMTESGQQYRTGGWGHLLGDKGSGYDIGLQSLQAVMSSFDGVEPPTLLTDLVLDKLGLRSPLELRSWIYQPSIQKQHIADVAELCIRAAEADDPAAIEIITKSATNLAKLTSALRMKSNLLRDVPIAVTGSIFHHSALYSSTYRQQLEQFAGGAITVLIAEQRPVFGAALLAAASYSSDGEES